MAQSWPSASGTSIANLIWPLVSVGAVELNSRPRPKDALVDRMGKSNVLLDVDAIHWDYGKDFRSVIRETIRIVSTVVVVMGPGNGRSVFENSTTSSFWN